MFVEVAVLAEVCVSPLAGPLPESLRGLANRGGMTGMLLPAASTAAMAERAAIEASAADADAERAAVEASAADAERAAVEASAAAVAERAAIEASAADAERAAVKASAAAVAERAAIEASAADAERATVEASAADAERAAVEASAADAERATLEASAAAVAVKRADSIKVCGQRASRRGARGGRRAVTRRRSVSCIPPNPIPLVVMLAHEGSRLHRGGKGEPGGIGASEGPSPLAHLTWEGSSHPLAQ